MSDNIVGWLRSMPSSLNDACRTMEEAADALEAKDAEIARLTVCLSNSEDQFQAKIGEVIAQMDRISDLERQLAEETERCARAVYGAVGMIPMGQVDASEFLDKIEDAIAAAIRGSRS